MGRGAQASFASIAIAACFFGSSSLHADTLPALAGGSGGCAVAGVRLSVIDAGATAIVEISAHLASMSKDATQRATCSVDWSLVMLSAPEGAASTPTIAIADSFVDHQRVLPVAFADGAGTATPHGFRGEVGAAGVTVALRLYVEGVDGGLTVELPRAALPKSTTEDAKLERRGKSARAVTAKFGVAGALALKAAPPGLSGGVGPTMPLSASTISLEIVPNGTPIEETKRCAAGSPSACWTSHRRPPMASRRSRVERMRRRCTPIRSSRFWASASSSGWRRGCRRSSRRRRSRCRSRWRRRWGTCRCAFIESSARGGS